MQPIDVVVIDLDAARVDDPAPNPGPPPPINPDQPVDVVVPDLSAARTESARVIVQETTAKIVAYIIVGTFAATILITLFICLGILWKSGDPTRVKLFGDAVLQVFEGVGKFVPAIFGSLLAFILGYYFSKEQKK
jgi:hypothetical protein